MSRKTWLRKAAVGGVLLLATGQAAAQDISADPKMLEGWRVFNRTCTVCHWPGVGGAPRIGDKAAWKDRIDTGMDVLYRHAIKGWTGPSGKLMPARGGNWNLTDEQVMAAVDYIVNNSQ